MKWFFYILGGFCFIFGPKEIIPAAVGLIVIGIPFHINDVKEEILKQTRDEHMYLKSYINNLFVKK